MNADVKEQWVKALRSGEYKQIKGVLRDRNGLGQTMHCCLGVLCNIHACATGSRWAEERHYRAGDGGALPEEVRDWAGLIQTDPLVPMSVDLSVSASLVNLNDQGMPFEEIAKVIETYL